MLARTQARGVAALLEKLENQTDKTSNNLSGITSKIMDISKKENQLKSTGGRALLEETAGRRC